MASALLIHELDAAGNRVKEHWYNKQVQTKLEQVTRFDDLIAPAPALYLTGLGALGTQKRLAAFLPRFGSYEVERVPADDRRVTASCRISHGKVPPINTRGG